MTHTDTNAVIDQSVKWALAAAKAIRDAGGNPEGLIARIPTEVIVTMVRNDIKLTYGGNHFDQRE